MNKTLNGDSNSSEDKFDRPIADDPPPVLGQWRRVYLAVLLYLACLLAVLTLISHAYLY